MNRHLQTLTPLLMLASSALGQLADQATPVEKINLADGFKAELLYSVP